MMYKRAILAVADFVELFVLHHACRTTSHSTTSTIDRHRVLAGGCIGNERGRASTGGGGPLRLLTPPCIFIVQAGECVWMHVGQNLLSSADSHRSRAAWPFRVRAHDWRTQPGGHRWWSAYRRFYEAGPARPLSCLPCIQWACALFVVAVVVNVFRNNTIHSPHGD